MEVRNTKIKELTFGRGPLIALPRSKRENGDKKIQKLITFSNIVIININTLMRKSTRGLEPTLSIPTRHFSV